MAVSYFIPPFPRESAEAGLIMGPLGSALDILFYYLSHLANVPGLTSNS